MESVDNQAKNEIHELLSELVVTPISKISNEFDKKVSNSLEELYSKLEDNSKSVTALKGNVDKIRKSVGEDLKDDFEDKVDSITLSMRNLSGELGKIPNQIIESYKSKHDEIISKTDKIQESIKAINVEEQKKDLLEAAEQLGNDITSISEQIEQESQEIYDKVKAIKLSMGDLSDKLGEIPSQIIDSYKSKHDEVISKTDKIQESIKAINVDELKKDLLEVVEQLGNNITGTSGQIEQKFQEIEDKVNTIMISLENINNLAEGINNNSITASKDQTNLRKQNIALIILSVIYLFGLIGVMIMYFIH